MATKKEAGVARGTDAKGSDWDHDGDGARHASEKGSDWKKSASARGADTKGSDWNVAPQEKNDTEVEEKPEASTE